MKSCKPIKDCDEIGATDGGIGTFHKPRRKSVEVSAVAHAPSKTPSLRRWRKLQLAASALMPTPRDCDRAQVPARVPARQVEACATIVNTVCIASFDRLA